jgi:hypothetical protein
VAVEMYSTNQMPLIPFVSTINMCGINDCDITDGDIGIKVNILDVLDCTFASTIISLPTVREFVARKCLFDQDKLPSMPNIEYLTLIDCDSSIQFSNDMPKIHEILYENMNPEFKRRLEQFQLNTLDVLSEILYKVNVYSYNHNEFLINVNGDPSFFKDSLNAHKTDMTHYTLLKHHLLTNLDTQRITRSMSKRNVQSLNQLFQGIMNVESIEHHIEGFIKKTLITSNLL